MHLEALKGLYTRRYYLDDCEGHHEFLASSGVKLPRRLAKCLRLMDVHRGDRVLDVGCGRGELALHSARRGATCLAIDPSRAGLEILGEAMESWDLDDSMRLWRLAARGEELPVARECMDCVIVSDVVEHLDQHVLDRLLSECHRVLRSGGRLVIHTQPNRLLVQFTVPVLSRFSFLWGTQLPADLRSEMTPGARAPYHVNEQSRADLKRSLLRAHFQVAELWLEGSYPVHRIFGDTAIKNWVLPLFRRWRWLKELLASQLFAVARKNV